MTGAYIFVLLLVGIASNRVEPDDDEQDPSVFLLQTSKVKDKVLPELFDILDKQQSTYQDVRDSMGAFEKRMLFASQLSEAHIVVLKAHLEQNLTVASMANSMANTVVEQQNADLLLLIGSLTQNVSKLLGDCAKLQESNKRWSADLQAMLVNFSSAQEFIDLALNDSVEALGAAPELKILDELNEIEMTRRAKQAHERSLSEVQHAVALLQVDQDINEEGHDLIGLLGDGMINLEMEEMASKASLLSAFQKDYDDLAQRYAQRHAQLLERQDGLNHTKDAQADLQRRLNLAVANLQESQTVLQERSMAVRAFEMSMASKPIPENVGSSTDKTPVSLLQTSLPIMKDVLQDPGTAFKDMSQQEKSFTDAEWAVVQNQSTDDLSQLQQTYDGQLQGS